VVFLLFSHLSAGIREGEISKKGERKEDPPPLFSTILPLLLEKNPEEGRKGRKEKEEKETHPAVGLFRDGSVPLPRDPLVDLVDVVARGREKGRGKGEGFEGKKKGEKRGEGRERDPL